MSKAVLYNDKNLAVTIIPSVISFKKEEIEDNRVNYLIQSKSLGSINMKGSSFGIAFFDDSVEIEEYQDIRDLMHQELDKAQFISLSKDDEIAELKGKIETLEGAIIDLMESIL